MTLRSQDAAKSTQQYPRITVSENGGKSIEGEGSSDIVASEGQPKRSYSIVTMTVKENDGTQR